jgi:uncharacterized protein
MNPHIKKIRAFAEHCFANSPGSHDWEHTVRVHTLSLHIGRIERADLDVVEAAAFLHDIARPEQDASKGKTCHAAKGAAMTAELLRTYPFPDGQQSNIIHCVRSHRFRENSKPETLEAKVLYDADKLDSIGAIGVGRAFLFAGEVGARLHIPDVRAEETEPYSEEDTGYREFKLKLSKIKDRMLTAEGRRIAERRHTFMKTFFERFLKEYKGTM